jgi:DNA-binding XRE family transcriptional regulator
MNINLLKSRRVLLGLSQERMAELLEVSQQNYCEKENNKKEFRLHEIVQLKRLLGLTADEINEIFMEE